MEWLVQWLRQMLDSPDSMECRKEKAALHPALWQSRNLALKSLGFSVQPVLASDLYGRSDPGARAHQVLGPAVSGRKWLADMELSIYRDGQSAIRTLSPGRSYIDAIAQNFGILLDVDYNDFAPLGQIWNLKEMENTMNQNLSVLINELKNRAQIYIHIYRELSKEVGKEKAAEIMKKALYARGKEKGLQLAGRLGEPNLHKMAHCIR